MTELGETCLNLSFFDSLQPQRLTPLRFELVEKGQRPFPTKELHDRQGSISGEKVALSVMRSVISEVHAPGNDVIGLYSVICG